MLPAMFFPVRRACDLTSSQRFYRMELLMTSPKDDYPSGPAPRVGGSQLGSWEEWGRYMLEEMRSLKREVQKLNEKHTTMRIDLAVLKTKVAFIGAVAGAIGAGITTWIVNLIRSKS